MSSLTVNSERASLEAPVNADGALGDARVSDLALVLVRPAAAFAKERRDSDVARLLLLIVSVDFVLSLLLLPFLLASLERVMAAGSDGAAARVTALAGLIVVSSSANSVLIGLLATVTAILFVILGRPARFGQLVSLIALASAPLILERVVRVVAGYAVGWPIEKSMLLLSSLGLEGFAAANFFTVFDVWAFALVLIGAWFRGFRTLPTLLPLVAVWAGLQTLLLQFHLYAGANT